MRKYVVAALIAGFVAFMLYFKMLKTAKEERDDILFKFKEIDAQLDSFKEETTGNRSGVKAMQGFLSITLTNSVTILLVDSLIEHFEKDEITNPLLKEKTARLLSNLQEINKFKWAGMDSATPDTITYWRSTTGFTYQKWLDKYFCNNDHDNSIIYLRKLKADIIRNNY